jgi:glucokinase
VERFLSAIEAEPAARRRLHLAIAIAGPARGENLALTNLHWSFSRSGLRERLGLARLEVLNDFEALARAVPLLAGDERLPVKEGSVEPEAPIAVLGPGTGLGVAALVPDGERFHVIAGEGGHRDLAATTDEEWTIVSRLASRFGHVSAERVLSGPGLENLFAAISPPELAGEEVVGAAEIARRSRAGEPRARRATELFSSWLGAFAGDLALTLGARGGVYLAGGVLSGLGEAFDVGRFRDRFLAKGRFRTWLDPIPIWRIVRSDAALLGCAGALASSEA